MDKATAARLLELAEARAREAVRRTERQRRLVAELERLFGKAQDHARDVLEQLELSARVLGQECDRLRAIRDGAPEGGSRPPANSPTQLLH